MTSADGVTAFSTHCDLERCESEAPMGYRLESERENVVHKQRGVDAAKSASRGSGLVGPPAMPTVELFSMRDPADRRVLALMLLLSLTWAALFIRDWLK